MKKKGKFERDRKIKERLYKKMDRTKKKELDKNNEILLLVKSIVEEKEEENASE
jgi:hypothetical protein